MYITPIYKMQRKSDVFQYYILIINFVIEELLLFLISAHFTVLLKIVIKL